MGKVLQKILRLPGFNGLAALFMAAFLSVPGCSTPTVTPGAGSAVPPARALTKAPAPAQSTPKSKEDKKASLKKSPALIRVYYATDRSRAAQTGPGKFFGGQRGALSYGTCEVSIPRTQKAAALDERKVVSQEVTQQTDNQPVLRKVSPLEYDDYLGRLGMTIAKSNKKSAFVFVHGYNVTFADAARRTAQMKYALGFEGAPIFFSWPSKGHTDAYPADESDVEWAQPDLKEFLKDLAAKTKAQNIYLIGHSMGNRALAKAYIYLISERPELKKVFREVILVAPDIDTDLFKRDIAPALATSANRTTLYSSSNDLTLKASTKFQNYPRAGDSGSNLILFDGIETIDATNVNTGLMRYFRITDNSSVLADIYQLIRDGKKPAERSGLKTVNASLGQYWRFKSR
jgi:esterase/lipase superfamily enzyme